ncbi:MAG TPA: CBS domain-containing protein [Draconibacterium sp.]|nr:CBS domain-containing protein [Draconibacterium sp.]
MLAEKLISDSLTSVNSAEKGKKALNAMDVYRVSHIPVVNGSKYLGLVSDKLIYDLNLLDVPIENQLDKLNTSHAHKEQHIFEVAILMYKLKLSVLPVLDNDHYYFGAITLYDLARRFAKLFSLEEIGGVIILEMNVNNYSLAEISQIVESNDIKILSCFMDRKHGTNVLDVILKLDKDDLSSLIQAFMRYDYNVKAVYLDQSELRDLFKDRFDQFMKFMNI